MSKELCLVTGGAGFIGSHVAEGLLKEGFRVRVLDDFSTGKEEHIEDFKSRVELIRGSLTNESEARTAVAGVTYVFHQGAIRSVPKSVDDPTASNNVNVTGTLNVLKLSRELGVKMVVYASSSSVYGDGKKFPQKEAFAPQPISPYAVSKLAGEHYARVYAKSMGLATVSLRYFNVYGPRQNPESIYSAVIPRFMELAQENKPIEIHWDGKQSRDFTCVQDVVEANLLALKAPATAYGEAFNIACGKTYSILDLVRFLENTLGHRLAKVFQPMRQGDARKTWADISKARKTLGYKPKVSFEEGLKLTWNYFNHPPAGLAGKSLNQRVIASPDFIGTRQSHK